MASRDYLARADLRTRGTAIVDVQHRSVAAEIVTFLETLRDDLTPAIAVEASAW